MDERILSVRVVDDGKETVSQASGGTKELLAALGVMHARIHQLEQAVLELGRKLPKNSAPGPGEDAG